MVLAGSLIQGSADCLAVSRWREDSLPRHLFRASAWGSAAAALLAVGAAFAGWGPPLPDPGEGAPLGVLSGVLAGAATTWYWRGYLGPGVAWTAPALAIAWMSPLLIWGAVSSGASTFTVPAAAAAVVGIVVLTAGSGGGGVRIGCGGRPGG